MNAQTSLSTCLVYKSRKLRHTIRYFLTNVYILVFSTNAKTIRNSAPELIVTYAMLLGVHDGSEVVGCSVMHVGSGVLVVALFRVLGGLGA